MAIGQVRIYLLGFRRTLANVQALAQRNLEIPYPLTDHDFNEATTANQNLVQGKEVMLVKDVSDIDRYNRLLRYVFVDNVFVNSELVKQGYATTASFPADVACIETFRVVEAEAVQAGLGLWSISQTETPTAIAAEIPNIKILTVFYDGSGNNEPDEYVEIKNNGSQAVQLSGWTLRDKADHIFTFPAFLMEPSQICRVYTDENHPESCGFNFNFNRSAIWNNGGDCAYFRDNNDTEMDQYCY